MSRLTLDQARRIIAAGQQAAHELAAKPLALVVLDGGGHALAVERHERASLFRAEIATAKAKGALGMGQGSRALAERTKASPAFFASLAAVTGGQIVPAAGGVLIRDEAGEIIGAVGVSGDTPDMDETCAMAGIGAVGLVGDPGKAS